MQKQKNKQKGITLIALVVTIIVLIILAGVSINMLVGENGIITQTQRASQETEQGQVEEQKQLAMLEAVMNTENQPYTDKNGDTAIIPVGFAVSQVDGENTVESGLVIIDKDGNEYVWIPVNDFNIFVQDLDYKVNNYSDNEYDFSYGYINNEHYARMLDSVKKYKGFYIGRYEAGCQEARYSKSDSIIKNDNYILPKSQKNLYPYNYVTRNQAQILARSLGNNDFNVSLMYGIQWDAVLRFITQNSSNSVNDGTEWGNYADVIINFNNEDIKNIRYAELNDWNLKTWKSITSTDKKPVFTVRGNGWFLTTGASAKNKVLNIYDFSGNISEWTIETYNSSLYPICIRGGSGETPAKEAPATFRYLRTEEDSAYDTGFRVALYLN